MTISVPRVALAIARSTVAREPTRSSTMRAPPPVAATSCRAASVALPSITESAPASIARSRLAASMSTTIAPLPPIARSTDSAMWPRPPAPITTTGSSAIAVPNLRSAL